MRKKVKKSVKGMTLIECIIAIAVLAIMGGIAAKTGQIVSALMLDTNHVNNKVAAEAPYGAVQDVDGITDLSSTTGVSADGAEISISVGGYGSPVVAHRYSTAAAAVDAANNGTNTNTNMDADLRFYVITPTP